MKKQKDARKKYTTINIVIGATLAATVGILIYYVTQHNNTSDQEFLNLRDHLLSRFIQLDYGKDNRVCEMVENGLSKDNDIYVKFWCQDYDEDTHEPSEKVYHTLYFQHPTIINGYPTSYAEALGE